MANHMEPVKGLVGRVARRRLTQVEVEAGSRLPRLQQVLDWLPRCWSHINKFLETHSSSDVTIGKGLRSYTYIYFVFINFISIISCHVRVFQVQNIF